MQGKLRAFRTWFYGRIKVVCTWCNGIGGHVTDSGDFHACSRCGGEGDL